MTPEQRAAHIRMLGYLPVRAHREPGPEPRNRRNPPPTREKLREARKLDGKVPRKKIARMLGISAKVLRQKLGCRRR